MKKLSVKQILFGDYYSDTKRFLLNVAQPYISRDVEDYIDNKDIIDTTYSTIIISDVNLSHMNENGIASVLIHQDSYSFPFIMSDESGSSKVLWPDIITENIDSKLRESFIDKPRYVDGVILYHDQINDNSFITVVQEGSYERGLERVMEEIGWKTD